MAVLGFLAALVGCSHAERTQWQSQSWSAFELSADGRTLQIEAYGGASNCPWKFRRDVVERSGSVTIDLTFSDPTPSGTPCHADQTVQGFTIRLRRPLGDRKLVDASTSEVRRLHSPQIVKRSASTTTRHPASEPPMALSGRSRLEHVFKVWVSVDQRTLTFETNDDEPPCGSHETWRVVEAEGRVTIRLRGWQAAKSDAPVACERSLTIRPVSVRLRAPLGDRAVYDASTGGSIRLIRCKGTERYPAGCQG